MKKLILSVVTTVFAFSLIAGDAQCDKSKSGGCPAGEKKQCCDKAKDGKKPEGGCCKDKKEKPADKK